MLGHSAKRNAVTKHQENHKPIGGRSDRLLEIEAHAVGRCLLYRMLEQSPVRFQPHIFRFVLDKYQNHREHNNKQDGS